MPGRAPQTVYTPEPLCSACGHTLVWSVRIIETKSARGRGAPRETRYSAAECDNCGKPHRAPAPPTE
jgi:rRNA maturation protein Nop10